MKNLKRSGNINDDIQLAFVITYILQVYKIALFANRTGIKSSIFVAFF